MSGDLQQLRDCLCDVVASDKCPMHGGVDLSDPTVFQTKATYEVLKEKGGILLDVGSGTTRRKGFVHMDIRPLDGIDIVWDFEKFPWPLPDESCITVTANHVVEHIKPWVFIDWMNEIWRITKADGQLAISMPYGVGPRFLQDPTHCNACNETTWQYFDPRFPLWQVYEPKPWHIDPAFPIYRVHGDMEVVMTKANDNATPNES